MIIDSHCHLGYKDNNNNIDLVIKNAESNDVKVLLNIATKQQDFKKLRDISLKYKNVYYTLGIHPHESFETNQLIIDEILKYSDDDKLIGVGETGLDFFYNHSDKKTQIRSLEMHIELAQLTNLPLVIHMRDAEEDFLNICHNSTRFNYFKGVIHCFTGTLKFAQKALDLGFYISASGVVTFKKSFELRETFKKIPLNRLLVETDSPFLSPEPMRGKINEPSNIIYTINELSNIYNVDTDEISKQTTNNFLKLFNKVKLEAESI